MKSPNINTDFVSIHTLKDTPSEKLDLFTDEGRFADDLAAHGLELLISNKGTFESGRALNVTRTDEGVSAYVPSIAEGEISAMHVRLIGKVNVSGSEDVLKVNDNSLKALAGSKYELYKQVLVGEQVETHFVSMQPNDFDVISDMIDAIATDNVVLKSNSGSGGHTTKIQTKKAAIQWVRENMSETNAIPQILQAQVIPGPIPDSVRGVDEYGKHLTERARKEGLLYELRMFAIKRGENCDMVPVLRVVPDKDLPMKGTNDDYLDVELDSELFAALALSAKKIMDDVCQKSNAGDFALGAIDYYFDENGIPHVMEANLRSPQLPSTNDTPIAGRNAHKALALSFREMIDQRKES